MKAFVHIGAPKTGTSSIQAFLRANVDALAARGVHYDIASPNQKSQIDLPLAVRARLGVMLPNRDEQLRYGVPDMETLRARGEAAMARLSALVPTWPGQVAVFSSEHIYPWLNSVEAVHTFDTMMGEIFSEVRYILYIRDQEELILSLYSQDVKNGGSARLHGFFNRILRFMDLEQGVMRWVDAIGRDRFDLRLLDKEFLAEGDLLTDFALACGLPIEGLDRPPPMNERLTAAGAELLRTLNARIPHILPEGGFNPLTHSLVAQVTGLSDPGTRISLSPEQRKRLNARVAAGNEALRAALFPDRPSLFTERETAGAPAGRPLAEALDLAAQMIIRLRMGEWQALPEQDRARARVRTPTENGSTVAAAETEPQSPPAVGAAQSKSR